MKVFKIKGRDIEMPECIDELTPEQYRRYLRLATALTSGVINVGYFRVRWMSDLIGMHEATYKILLPEHITEVECAASELMPGFLVDGVPCLFTCRNLMGCFDGHDGPGDWLEGVSWGVFCECVTALELAQADDDADRHYRRIAQLMYGYTDDDFISPLLVYHCVLMLCNVWRAIQTEPVNIDGREIDLSIIFKGSANSRPDDNTGWLGITMEVAQTGLFGTVADVRSSSMWDVLVYLYKCKFENDHEKH